MGVQHGTERSPSPFQEPLEPDTCNHEAVEQALSRGRRPEPHAESRPLGVPQGDLQCPHCLQCFSDEQGEELLRHVGQCCQ